MKRFLILLAMVLIVGTLSVAPAQANSPAATYAKLASGQALSDDETYVFLDKAPTFSDATSFSNYANRLLAPDFNLGVANTGFTDVTPSTDGSTMYVGRDAESYTFRIKATGTTDTAGNPGYHITQNGSYLDIIQTIQTPQALAPGINSMGFIDGTGATQYPDHTANLTYPYTYLDDVARTWYWDGTNFYSYYTTDLTSPVFGTDYTPSATSNMEKERIIYRNGQKIYVNLDNMMVFSHDARYNIDPEHVANRQNIPNIKLYLCAVCAGGYNTTNTITNLFGSLPDAIHATGPVLSVADYNGESFSTGPSFTRPLESLNSVGNRVMQFYVSTPILYHVTTTAPVSLTVTKDYAAWSGTGVEVALYQGSTKAFVGTVSATTSKVNLGNVKYGTYDVYVSGIKSDYTLSVNDTTKLLVTGSTEAQTELKTYTLTVERGTGGGVYGAGASVPIVADAPAADKVFQKWTISITDADGTAFTASSKLASRSQVMSGPTAVSALYSSYVTVTVEGGQVSYAGNPAVASGRFPSNEFVAVTAVPPAGKKFDHWDVATTLSYYDKSSFNVQLLDTAGYTFRAVFTDITYTVTFDDGDAATTDATATTTYGGTVTLPTTDPVAAGQAFDGWYTAASGGDLFTAATPVDADITVHARFCYPVSGITGIPNQVTVGDDLTLTGTVAPTNATRQTIAWSVKQAGTTGAALAGTTLSNTASGSMTITATIADGLHLGSDYVQDFTITVAKKTPTLTDLSALHTITYGQSIDMTAGVTGYQPTGTATLSEGSLVLATATLASGQATLTATPVAAGPHTYKLDYTGDANNQPAALTIDVTVQPAPQTFAETLTMESRTPHVITLTTLAPNTIGATAEYRIDGGPWQSSPVFTGLAAASSHTFEARWAATANYAASAAGTPITLTTGSYVITGPGKVVKGTAALFSSDADYALFVNVQIDGRDLEPTAYAAVPGSTDVTLLAAYVKTLAVGTHTITIVSDDGQATASFAVVAPAVTPDTGDTTMVGLWLLLMLVSAGALYRLTDPRRRGIVR